MTAPLILCVEDEPSLRDDIAFELQEAGYIVSAVGDAREALACLESMRRPRPIDFACVLPRR